MNLIEGLLLEIKRNNTLLDQYRAIGPSGAFGIWAIGNDIKEAEAAIVTGDTVAMIQILATLKANK